MSRHIKGLYKLPTLARIKLSHAPTKSIQYGVSCANIRRMFFIGLPPRMHYVLYACVLYGELCTRVSIIWVILVGHNSR